MALGNKGGKGDGKGSGKSSDEKALKSTAPKFTKEGDEQTANVDDTVKVDDTDKGGNMNNDGDAVETAAVPAVKQEAGAVATKGTMALSCAHLQDAMPPIEFGVLPRLKGAAGVLMDGDNTSIGHFAIIELGSWCYTYQIAPGDDSDEAKEYVQYSSDGKVIDNTGEAIADYIARNREQFPDMVCKKYVELTGILTDCADPDKGKDMIDSLVQVSLSPQAVKTWEAYRLQQMVKVRRGVIEEVENPLIKITATPASFGKFNYTKLVVSAA